MAASYAHENVRVKVKLNGELKNVCPKELAQRWTIICFKDCPTIKDVENKIVNDLNREPLELGRAIERDRIEVSSCDIWLNGFWLPSYENSKILRENDEITVCLKTSSNPLEESRNLTVDAEGREKKRKRKSQTHVYDFSDGISIKIRKHNKTYEELPSQGEDDVLCIEKKKHKKHKHKKSTPTKISNDSEDDSSGHDGSITNQDTTKSEKNSKKKGWNRIEGTELTKRPKVKDDETVTVMSLSKNDREPINLACLSGGLLNPSTLSIEKENQTTNSTCERSKQLTGSHVQEKQTMKSVVYSPKLSTSRNNQSVTPIQKKECTFYHPKTTPKPAMNVKSSSETPVNSAPDRPSNVQTLPTASGDALKRKRRRKKKNKEKEVDSLKQSRVQPQPEIKRDYSLRLPQHLRPLKNNRLLFDDDDDEDNGGGNNAVDIDDHDKQNTTDNLAHPIPQTVQGSPVKASTPKPTDKQIVNKIAQESPISTSKGKQPVDKIAQKPLISSSTPKTTNKEPVDTITGKSPISASKPKQLTDKQVVDRIAISKHRKMAVSAIFENLGKHRETSKLNGHSKASKDNQDHISKVSSPQQTLPQKATYKNNQDHIPKVSSPQVTLPQNSTYTNIPANSKPACTSFVSADDKFASLLGNTKRLSSNVHISPGVVPKHKTEPNSKSLSEANKFLGKDTNQTDRNGPNFLPQHSSVTQQTPTTGRPANQSTVDRVTNMSGPDTMGVDVHRNVLNPPSRPELEEGLKPWPSYSSVESLPDLRQLPKPGDFLIYKTLELSEDYTPVLSDYKKALVIEVDTSSSPTQLELFMSDAEKKRQGRFELEEDPQNETDTTETCDKKRFLATVSWADMVGTKLLLKA